MTRFYASLEVLYIHGHHVLRGYFNLQRKIDSEKHYDQLDLQEIYSFNNGVWSTILVLVYSILMQFNRYQRDYHHVQLIKNLL